MRNSLALAALALALAACRSSESDRASTAAAGGTMVISVPADADFLLPPLIASLQGKQISDMLFDHLAEIGERMNTVGDQGFEPRLARSWDWSKDSLSIAFHLDPRARWHDGAPVRAADVKLSYELFTDPAVASPVAPLFGNVDSIGVRDSLTAVAWFKQRAPEQFFELVYNLAIVPEHLLGKVSRADLRTAEFNRRPVGTGRFRFVRWEPRQTIELVADTANYRGRAKLDRVIWTISPDFNTGVTKLFAGEADFWEILRPENVAELARHPELKTMPYATLSYGAMLLNQKEPGNRRQPHHIFSDVGVRRALTMALDRQAMLENVFKGQAVVPIGPVTRALATWDSTVPVIRHDAAAAARLLDSLGWKDANGDGVREKNGRPLAFTLLVPNSSQSRVQLSILIQEQLKQVGAKVDVERLEFNAFSQRMIGRDFDAVMNTWVIDPTPSSIRQSWSGSAARATESSNYASYENPALDAAVDSATASFDPAKAKAFYRRAYTILAEDAPAVWLYEPRFTAGIHRRIQPTGLRPDAWWAGLPDWSIPVSQRIARDGIGLRPAAD